MEESKETKLDEYESIYDIKRKPITYDYVNKVCLAPMVRVGTLPFRLLAQDYGADILYTEEIIDKKLLQCERRYNTQLKTLELVLKKQGHEETVYQTDIHKEYKPVVLQIGTANAAYALKTAQHCEGLYDGLDINMGCPKHFSISGGMGAALLKKPEIVKDILTTLKGNLKQPITCKIRLFEEDQPMIDFVKMIEATGVDAIAIHGRTKDMRPKEPALVDRVKFIASHVNCPTIFNGDIYHFNDIEEKKVSSGCSSVMVARGALYNVSIFQKEMKDPIAVTKEYLTYCRLYQIKLPYVGYALRRMYERTTKEYPFTEVLGVRHMDVYDDIFSPNYMERKEKGDTVDRNLGRRPKNVPKKRKMQNHDVPHMIKLKDPFGKL